MSLERHAPVQSQIAWPHLEQVPLVCCRDLPEAVAGEPRLAECGLPVNIPELGATPTYSIESDCPGQSKPNDSNDVVRNLAMHL